MLFFWRESGRQVEILGDVRACDDEAEADWRERHNFSGTPNPDWQVWSLQPTRFEFLQATHDRNHTRLEYLRDKGQWRRSQLKPSESTSS